ncbi:MAG: RdgB/HAM1 family non-canonical purine NTP pyrophosphatase [Leptospirillia bacterium]
MSRVPRLLLATGNPDKAAEMAALLAGLRLTLLTRNDFSNLPEVEETADSFAGNAILKARSLADAAGVTALADDSGLCVDALSGAPGIYSARYAGEGCSYRDNNEKLLAALTGVPRESRTARFVCVVAIVAPGGDPMTFEGLCEGHITSTRHGDAGFGYDPVFEVGDSGVTFAQMAPAEKGRISHRAMAFKRATAWLAEHIQDLTT